MHDESTGGDGWLLPPSACRFRPPPQICKWNWERYTAAAANVRRRLEDQQQQQEVMLRSGMTYPSAANSSSGGGGARGTASPAPQHTVSTTEGDDLDEMFSELMMQVGWQG